MSHNTWSGKLGFILASAGAAVGIGNIWRFPYIIGEQGGATFIMLYVIFVFAIGMPLLVAEITLGRYAKINLIDGLKKIAHEANKSPLWSVCGWFSLLTLLMILSFYSVVSGWIIFYLKASIIKSIPTDIEQIKSLWSNLLSDYKIQIIFHAIFISLTMFVVAKGVIEGLEMLNNILMPMLFILLILLVIYAAFFTSSFAYSAKFLFSFDIRKINSNAALQALGQACFSLAIGAGAMFVYGSYLPKKIDITSSASYVAIIQLVVGILAGLAIFPIIFDKNLPPEYGPGLMFVAIPNAFAGMAMTDIIMTSFFLLLLFAALTSSINLAEPLVSTLCAKFSVSRQRSSVTIGIIAFILGIPLLLSFNLLANYKIMEKGLFELVIHIVTNFMLPIGGIMYAIYATYIIAKDKIKSELRTNRIYYNIWYYSVKYLAPITLLLILIS